MYFKESRPQRSLSKTLGHSKLKISSGLGFHRLWLFSRDQVPLCASFPGRAHHLHAELLPAAPGWPQDGGLKSQGFQ